jgi:superfamily II DNA or RNA helicase
MLTNNGYVLSKKSITKENLEKLKDELNVKPIVNKEYVDEVESFPVFKEDKITITLPRYYGIKKFPEKPPKDCFDITNSVVDFEFTGKLRDHQMQLATEILEKIKSDGGGILQLHTGYGKTTMALYLASVLKLKTLVIVHKTFLQDQWYERIKQFTTASIGMIRQKKIDVAGKDIVIGMLQSISMIDYDPKIFEDIGLLIFDECHHSSSRVFSRALLKVCPKYTLGLSATPIRQDGLTKVIKWFIGDIIAKVERKGTNAVFIKKFEYTSNDDLFVEKKRWFKGKIKPDPTKMITNMYKMNNRNKFVANIINSLRKQDERKTLVLSGRIEHLRILKKLVDAMIQEDVNKGIICEDEIRTSFYIGGMKEYELKDSAETDIIFASYSMAEEGLDIEGLNTLVLATPKKNIIQSIGRIMRKPIQEGDINPLIVDIIDDFSLFNKWGEQRIQYYNKNKYTINTYKANDDSIITFLEYLLQTKVIKKNQIKDLDIRKEYIMHKFGPSTYQFESDTDFYNYPDKMFNYPCEYDEVLRIEGEITGDEITEKNLENVKIHMKI